MEIGHGFSVSKRHVIMLRCDKPVSSGYAAFNGKQKPLLFQATVAIQGQDGARLRIGRDPLARASTTLIRHSSGNRAKMASC